MSVWSIPCYSVEPLRYVCNNLPVYYCEKFPEFLEGISDFTYGDCSIRHNDRAGQKANNFYRENPKEWKKFFLEGTRTNRGSDSVKFANTIKQANVKYSGIRAVYWAFKKIREDKWKSKKTFDKDKAIEFSAKAYVLGSAASRDNVKSAQEDVKWYEEGAGDESGWATLEEKADAFRFLWTIRTSKSVSKLNKKTQAIINGYFKARFVSAETKDDETISFEEVSTRFKSLRPFDINKHNATYKDVMNKIRDGIMVSAKDAIEVSILPYVSYPNKSSRLVVFVFKNGLILYDKNERVGGIFLEKDYDRLVQMLQADAKLTMYYSKYSLTEKGLSSVMIAKYNKIINGFLNSLDLTSDVVCNKYCRAYDVLQFYYLATLADDVNDDALERQRGKIKSEEIDKILDVNEFISVVDDDMLGVKESLELVKFYKIFPCPDYCIYSVVDSLDYKSRDTYPAHDNYLIGTIGNNEVRASVEEFKKYIKRNKIIMFYDAHGFLPGEVTNTDCDSFPSSLRGYPDILVENIDVNDVDYIDISGSFDYRKYDGCEDELIKDKSIAPLTHLSDTRKVSEFSIVEKNQVMKFLFSTTFMKQNEVRDLVHSDRLFRLYKPWILLALKAEAKKPGSRVFMIGTDEQRRFLSEFEANVNKYLKVQRGSSVGKSTIELDKRLGELSETPMLEEGLIPIMFSFDLAGFSNQQNPRFKELAVASWAEVFGEPYITNVLDIFTKTSLHYQKYDVDDNLGMKGNDLEGYNAKLNTSAHLDVMGYSVYKLKQLGLTKGNAGLEVFVDDGLLRVKIDVHDIGARRTIDAITNVYRFAGLEVSWDKTFTSRVVCQYLNRVYYDGIEVTPGAKAFMRIGKKQEVAIPTMADELMAHAATSRGAIQNGTEHCLAHYAYLFECFKTFCRWGLKEKEENNLNRLAFCCYVPVGLGGFGLSTRYNISTNESFNAMQSGIANMKLICHSFPVYASVANVYLNAGVREMDSKSILRNPNGFRTNLRCLNLRRFANAARAKVMRTSTNILIREANRGAFDKLDNSIIATVSAMDKISEVKRKLLWDMTFVSYVDKIVGKLQSSDTAASLLGRKVAFAIAIANRSEARVLLSETVTGNLSVRNVV
jgi:hypothetical protein